MTKKEILTKLRNCECYKYIYDRCAYCEDNYIRSTIQYKVLKKLIRKANRDMSTCGRIQKDTEQFLKEASK